MANVSMTVNGRTVERTVEDRTLLVQFLREDLGLTGTHVGCDTSQCGACVVNIDGKAVKSCTTLAVQADGASIMTIRPLEGWGDGTSNSGMTTPNSARETSAAKPISSMAVSS